MIGNKRRPASVIAFNPLAAQAGSNESGMAMGATAQAARAGSGTIDMGSRRTAAVGEQPAGYRQSHRHGLTEIRVGTSMPAGRSGAMV